MIKNPALGSYDYTERKKQYNNLDFDKQLVNLLHHLLIIEKDCWIWGYDRGSVKLILREIKEREEEEKSVKSEGVELLGVTK